MRKKQLLTAVVGFVALSVLLTLPAREASAQVVFQAAGPDAASIQGAVDGFRTALGDLNTTLPALTSGRREINWDGVPTQFAAPNALPADFFNINSPRGVVLSTPGDEFQVSGALGVAPIEFDNLDPTFSSLFAPFSPQRLFTAVNSNITDVTFFVPGSNQFAAATNGFGVVFTDVDAANTTSLEFFDITGPVFTNNNGVAENVMRTRRETAGTARVRASAPGPSGIVRSDPIGIPIL